MYIYYCVEKVDSINPSQIKLQRNQAYGQLEALGSLKLQLKLGLEVEAGIAQWTLLSSKTYPKLSSFRLDIPGLNPGILETESMHASNELLSSSGLGRVKNQPE